MILSFEPKGLQTYLLVFKRHSGKWANNAVINWTKKNSLFHFSFFPDRESTLFVVIQLTDRNSFFFADEFIETTQKLWAEKLGLISNTKLVITDNWYLREASQETLRVQVNWKGGLATILEVLNKRWQTLDLISVFREIKRTLPVQYELFYQGNMDNWFSSRGLECHYIYIDDMLTCLPRLQKMDP